MKKLLIGLYTLFLLLLDGCGCSQSIDIMEPMYVSPTKYKKLSCEQLKEELDYYGDSISCKELKEKLVYISYTEYEKLSCKQLHEQLIKINERLDIKSQIEVENFVGLSIFIPFYLLTTAGVPTIMHLASDTNSSTDTGSRKVSESEILKGAYQTLKVTATKKNCSFAADMK